MKPNVDFLTIFVEKGLNVSFSKVKYPDIAPRVGLRWDQLNMSLTCKQQLRDIPRPHPELSIQRHSKQCSSYDEARSRFLSQVSESPAYVKFQCLRFYQLFNRFVSLFEFGSNSRHIRWCATSECSKATYTKIAHFPTSKPYASRAIPDPVSELIMVLIPKKSGKQMQYNLHNPQSTGRDSDAPTSRFPLASHATLANG